MRNKEVIIFREAATSSLADFYINVICLPTEAPGVLKNSLEMPVHSRIELEFGFRGPHMTLGT